MSVNTARTEAAPRNSASGSVLELLTYIEQAEKLKAKPAFTVPTEFFVAHRHDLAGLPELEFDLQSGGDDLWLRFPRMQEVAAPPPDEALTPWVTLSRSPDKAPQLKSSVMLADDEDGTREHQLADHPEIQSLFDWYEQYLWKPWAEAERPRREAIRRYKQLFSLHQAIELGGEETPLELVWGIGMASWRRDDGQVVRYPLLTQLCEIALDPQTLSLEVRPRDIEPRMELDCYASMNIPGVTQLEPCWKSRLGSTSVRISPFEHSGFEELLKAAVGYLDNQGAYARYPTGEAPPAADNALRISDAWVLFARKRSANIFLEDLGRLKKNVQDATTLPGVIRSLVERGESTVRVQPERPHRGLGSSEGPPGAFELYFPMAYNDEQVAIVQKLENNDGVVVQGPPGTGKTHTIANVICHYLAQGKSVLVTAKTETALAVLQDKLPERIRPLSVALLANERDGMKQFEHAIQTIASTVGSLNPTRVQSDIARAEASLDQLHGKIAEIDRMVAANAARHMHTYQLQNREVTPEELARFVLEQAQTHEWFDDESIAPQDEELPFTDADVAALRSARMSVGEDIVYLGCKLPDAQDLPAWTQLLALHRDIVRARGIESLVADGAVLNLVDSRMETFERARELFDALSLRSRLQESLNRAPEWLSALQIRFAALQRDDTVLVALLELCTHLRDLETQRRSFMSHAIQVPADAELNADVGEAIVRLIGGKGAFALPLGKKEARKFIASITVLGQTPTRREDWELVQSVLAWRVTARQTIARWQVLSSEFGLPLADGAVDAGLSQLATWADHVETARRLAFDIDMPLTNLFEEVLGTQARQRYAGGDEEFVHRVIASLQSHLEKERLAYATGKLDALVRKLDDFDGVIVSTLRSFMIRSVGKPETDEDALLSRWTALQAELSRLTALQPMLEDIARVSTLLQEAGAVKWAERVRTSPASATQDPCVPAQWLEAWNWRQAVSFLDAIDGHHRIRELFVERRRLTSTLARTYQDLIAEKTWLGVHANSPAAIRQALQAYLNAVQAMGSGTGIRAMRHRRTARDAMTRAYKAVPCWVLPQWRVSEAIPAEIGLFDLVVVDEASQSDIWALPTLLRGRKLLIVGDHLQVSPAAVGTAEAKIIELSNRFLGNQPHGAEMTPDKSIYDLARVVFADSSVMLKEHFRSVPAIIEYSNREFYSGDIKPLRLPSASERIDPPLVDVFVKGGRRKGDENPAEAKAIVDEIEAILGDAQFSGRSIGVVTLLGTAQAKYINTLISKRIPQHDIVTREIAVGPPAVFQGRERDIMMVSMVQGPGDRSMPNSAAIRQRFNVAMSRARDRMYLFRSVEDSQVGENTLIGAVIRHFREPFRQSVRQTQTLRELCESGFEREVFDELVRRGYRVEPQVACGGFRIDLVVEGHEGRRLAIECDGDRFHGPGQWAEDMARQRVLERAGWTFWRCFASNFVRHRDEVLQDLFATLQRLGIDPVGSESVDNSLWVQHREADPFGIDVPSQNEEGEENFTRRVETDAVFPEGATVDAETEDDAEKIREVM